MKIEVPEHKPRTAQTFYCSRCDERKVDSTDPKTGRFFVKYGHSYNHETRDYDGEYMGVMFAYCHQCIPA